MRLLLDASAVPARPVGAGVYTCRLAGALDRLGECELHLLARRGDGDRWRDVAPNATVHAVVPPPRPARLAWEQVRAPRLAERLEVDVWHGPHYTIPLRLRVPAVTTVHDLTFLEHPEWHERSKVVFFRKMIPASAARAAVIVAVSEATAAAIGALLEPAAPVLTIAHGVDHDRFRPAPLGNPADLAALDPLGVRPPYVVFVGTIEPRKAVPTLVEAFSACPATIPTCAWSGRRRRLGHRGGPGGRRRQRGGHPDRAGPLGARRGAARPPPPGGGRGLLEPRGGLRPPRPRGPRQRCAARHVGRIPHGGDRRPGRPAGPTGERRRSRLGAEADPHRRRPGRAAPFGGPKSAAPYTWEASARLHLDAYRLAIKVAEEQR